MASMATAQTSPPTDDLVREIALDQIHESPLNTRRSYSAAGMEDLRRSIRARGIITPLIVRERPQGGYEIAAGHRRARGARAEGLTSVPALVRDLDETAFLEVLLIDNLQREDLNPIEQGEGFKAAVRFGLTLDDLAGRIQKSRRYLYDRIRLVDHLIPAAKTLLQTGHLEIGHAIVLARQTPTVQEQIIDPDSGVLFDHNGGLWGPEDDDDGAGPSPYLRLKAKTVQELEAWVATRTKFDPTAPVTAELFPETVATLEEAEKVVQITHEYHVRPEAKGGDTRRIYCHSSWKRADGQNGSTACAKTVTGVIVVGFGRGEAFKVCVNKDCDTHWKKERLEREKAARRQTGTASSEKDRYQRQREEQERARQREEASRKNWDAVLPAVLDATAARIRTASVVELYTILVRGSHLPRVTEARTRLKPGIGADDALRTLVLIDLIDKARQPYYGHRGYAALAKKLLGLDLAPVLKAAKQAAATPATAVTKKKTAKKTAKKTPVRKAR